MQLTFNHQRRFGAPFRKAYELLKEGAIGELERVEIACPNLYDWGTHYLDLCSLYVGEQPAEWVIGQIDYRTEQIVFGAPIENQAIANWRYRNGISVLMATGASMGLIGTDNRLVGSEGVIEVGVHRGPLLRVKPRKSVEWEVIDTGRENLHGPHFIERAIAHIIDALETGREPELSGRHAMNGTEIIFAIYESSRRRGRVDLPLLIEDNPLVAMIEAGELNPRPRVV